MSLPSLWGQSLQPPQGHPVQLCRARHPAALELLALAVSSTPPAWARAQPRVGWDRGQKACRSRVYRLLVALSLHRHGPLPLLPWPGARRCPGQQGTLLVLWGTGHKGQLCPRVLDPWLPVWWAQVRPVFHGQSLGFLRLTAQAGGHKDELSHARSCLRRLMTSPGTPAWGWGDSGPLAPLSLSWRQE